MPAAKKSLASRAGAVVRRAVSRSGEVEANDAETSVAEAPATKGSSKKASAKKAPAKNAPAKKAAATKAAATPAKKAVAATPAKKAPAKKGPAAKAPAAKAPVKNAPAKKQPRRGSAAALVVRDGESPWTAEELGEVRKHLRADVTRLEPELEHADAGLHDLMIDSGDGSGQDQADMGSSTFERDHELSIANNAREMLDQSRHALARIEDGTFGVCEGCGEPIGKLRLIAFPRATLCMTCKQREERR